ncbi:hypothetical protein M4D50_01055 [Rothia sp. p3-SID1597]|nr:hypothetical protein [Rothia sp. p3-SID1597]
MTSTEIIHTITIAAMALAIIFNSMAIIEMLRPVKPKKKDREEHEKFDAEYQRSIRFALESHLPKSDGSSPAQPDPRSPHDEKYQ